ncbi:MAG TPA: sugar phosphate isomerase/epimerase [Actinomycetota bacterium]|nr:sugar phosphate isomerase/epimerase [Actinomycetota bacterium]
MTGPKPRIICSTGSFWMWDLERAMGALAKAGFTGAELMVTRDPRTQNAEVAASIAAKEGIEFVALHAPMLVLTRRIWGPSFLPIIERSTEMAKKIGADVVIVHPPYIWELKYQSWLLTRMDRYSAENQVAIAVENMFRLWVRGRAIRGHRWMSPADLKGFSQLTLDTSHCGVDDFDILEALDLVGHQTAHVHLSDSRGDHRDNHLLPGTGGLPLKEFVSRLPEAGFRGNLSLELDLRSLVEDGVKLDDALRKAKEFCEDALA